MNILSRDQQIQVLSCLTEGMSIRATERLTGIHRDTIMRLGARVGRGCAELHERLMVGLRVGRLELDELWLSWVGSRLVAPGLAGRGARHLADRTRHECARAATAVPGN